MTDPKLSFRWRTAITSYDHAYAQALYFDDLLPKSTRYTIVRAV